jgi:hypothetical protein
VRVGNLVQWTPHATSPVDNGLGLVIEERRNVGGHLSLKIRWLCDITNTGNLGYWYAYPQDFDNIVVM